MYLVNGLLIIKITQEMIVKLVRVSKMGHFWMIRIWNIFEPYPNLYFSRFLSNFQDLLSTATLFINHLIQDGFIWGVIMLNWSIKISFNIKLKYILLSFSFFLSIFFNLQLILTSICFHLKITGWHILGIVIRLI